MNRLFTASILVALAAILLAAPVVTSRESVLAKDPTLGQDAFRNMRTGRRLKVRALPCFHANGGLFRSSSL